VRITLSLFAVAAFIAGLALAVPVYQTSINSFLARPDGSSLVTEPDTLALLGVSLLGVGLMRRRC
jgi:hypothetical protein